MVCFAFRSYADKTGRFLGGRAAINQISSSAKRLACVRFEWISVINALEGLLGLHREADGNLGRAVENFKDVIAQQTAKFAGGPRAACELDAPIAGTAARADDIGFFHTANMRLCFVCPA